MLVVRLAGVAVIGQNKRINQLAYFFKQLSKELLQSD